jgi:hypothetical protein
MYPSLKRKAVNRADFVSRNEQRLKIEPFHSGKMPVKTAVNSCLQRVMKVLKKK